MSYSSKESKKVFITHIIHLMTGIILIMFIVQHFSLTIYLSDQMNKFSYGDLCLGITAWSINTNDVVDYCIDEHHRLARVIYTPKSTVIKHNDYLLIDGSSYHFDDELTEQLLDRPDGYLLLNDNQDSTMDDSRKLGLIERTAIKTKIILMIRIRDF